MEGCHNIVKQIKNKKIVSKDYEALIFCHIMQMISGVTQDKKKSFAQQYVLEKGLKIFKERGKKSMYKEMK